MTARRDSSESKTQVDRIRDTNAGPKLLPSEKWRDIFRLLDLEANYRHADYIGGGLAYGTPGAIRTVVISVLERFDKVRAPSEYVTSAELSALCEFLAERLEVHRGQRHGFVWWPKGERDAIEK